MTMLVRKDAGQPLRDALRRRGLTASDVADATKRVDVTGKGISKQTVWKVTGNGGTATNGCRLRTAWLLTSAMGEPLQAHFDMPSVSTHTVERSTPHGDAR